MICGLLLVLAVPSFIPLAHGRKCVRVLDGLGRENGHLVTVNLNGPLSGTGSFTCLEPAFYISRTPDDLHLVLLQGQVVPDVEVWTTDLVERLI